MIKDDIEDYLTYLETTRHTSENTRSSYRRDLTRMRTLAERDGRYGIGDIDQAFLIDLTDEMKADSASESTIARMVSCLHGFYKYLLAEGRVTQDPSEGLRTAKAARGTRKKVSPEILTTEEVRRLLAAPDTSKSLGIRDAAILRLLYSTGIRTKELTRIRINDVDFLINYLTVREEDGSVRQVPFGIKTGAAIREYLSVVHSQMDTGNDILFINRGGTPISRQGIWKMVRKYGEQAGIAGEVTPMRLRSTLAAHLLERGADPESVREILGHESLASTRQYTRTHRNRLRSTAGYVGDLG